MKAHRIGAALLAAAAIFVSTSDARAAGHANGFGEKGQLILSADRLVPLFGYTHASISQTQNNVTATTSQNASGISLLFGRDLSEAQFVNLPINVHSIPRVAFDVTVINRLTLGAGIAFAFGLGGSIKTESINGATVTSRKSDAPTGTAIGLVPRIGYILPLGEHFAFWPRAGFGFYSVSFKADTTANNGVISTTKASDTAFSLDLDPQFAIIPTEHFFITVGPIVNIPIAGSRSTSTTVGATTTEVENDTSIFHLGLTAGLGGWLNIF